MKLILIFKKNSNLSTSTSTTTTYSVPSISNLTITPVTKIPSSTVSIYPTSTVLSSISDPLDIEPSAPLVSDDSDDEIAADYFIAKPNRKSDLFYKTYFLLISELSKDHTYLTTLIEENGGLVCQKHTYPKNPIVLVNNNFNGESETNKSKKFITVKKRKVPLYYEKFLHDCIQKNKLCDKADYLVPNQQNQPKKNSTDESLQEHKPKKSKFQCYENLTNGSSCTNTVANDGKRCDSCHNCTTDGNRCNSKIATGNLKYCQLHGKKKKNITSS